MKAKKSYGQHFLAQPAIARQIAEAVSREGISQILEVGPGKGMLTQFLLQLGLPLIAVEADRDMVAHLQERFPDWAATQLHQDDFLQVDLEALLQNQPTALVGNFPYNISSQILVKLVDHRPLFPRLIGMFQKELADRVLAPPGSKTYGAISVLVQAFYTGRTIIQVKPGSFNPPPKVDSSVISLERLSGSGPACSERILRQVIRTTFQQRRKMLRNSIKPLWTDFDPEDPSLQRRPEQLSVQDFIELTQRIEASRAEGN